MSSELEHIDRPQQVAEVVEENSQYNQLPTEDTGTIGNSTQLQENEGGDGPPSDVPPTETKDQSGVPVEEDCLTFRALFVGLLIGCLVGAMNVNFGLRTGWTQGGCIFSALVSIGIFKIIRPERIFTKSEAVIVTTTASAVGTMASAAGLVSSIPALKLLGHTYTIWELFLWALSIAYFGVYFAVPMRYQMIEVEKLRFPSGTVTAETIKTMFAESQETVKKAQVLTVVAIITSVYALLAFFVPYIQQPPLPTLLQNWGWVLYVNPLLLGGGMLSGPRSSSSLLIGSIIGWAILGPIVWVNGWTAPNIMHFDGVRGWILWVGVAIMTADSMVTLLFSVRMIFSGLMSICRRIVIIVTGLHVKGDEDQESEKNHIPTWWWVLGLVISTIMVTLVGQFYFSIQFYFVWISIPLSALLAIIAARCCGETDINPVGGMGKVTQLVYAGIAPNQITTNLLAAGITGSGASQCGDMMQDLKTGYLLNVSPRKQFLVQCIGIFLGTLVCIPIYKLFDVAYVIGGEDIPAPAAHAWKAVAQILAEGVDKLPTHSPYGMLGGAILGVTLALLYKLVHSTLGEDVSCYIPSALAIGIGFIVPPKQALAMFIGSMLLSTWRLVHPETANVYYFTISSGMVAGEGIMGIIIALLKLVGVKPLVTLGK